MHPAALFAKSSMLGMGYVSGTVTLLRRMLPSCFLTMCRGEAQGLFERRTIPARSRARNSFLAAASFSAASFSASSRRNLGDGRAAGLKVVDHVLCGLLQVAAQDVLVLRKQLLNGAGRCRTALPLAGAATAVAVPV